MLFQHRGRQQCREGGVHPRLGLGNSFSRRDQCSRGGAHALASLEHGQVMVVRAAAMPPPATAESAPIKIGLRIRYTSYSQLRRVSGAQAFRGLLSDSNFFIACKAG